MSSPCAVLVFTIAVLTTVGCGVSAKRTSPYPANAPRTATHLLNHSLVVPLSITQFDERGLVLRNNRCSATHINHCLLTAAHCFEPEKRYQVSTRFPLVIRTLHQVADLRTLRRHPDFRFDSEDLSERTADLAVLRSPVAYPGALQVSDLARDVVPFPWAGIGDNRWEARSIFGTAAGFGIETIESAVHRRDRSLQLVGVPVDDLGMRVPILVAVGLNQSSIGGDSGGAVFFGDATGQEKVYGVTSGHSDGGDRVYELVASVPDHYDWIVSQLTELGCNPTGTRR